MPLKRSHSAAFVSVTGAHAGQLFGSPVHSAGASLATFSVEAAEDEEA